MQMISGGGGAGSTQNRVVYRQAGEDNLQAQQMQLVSGGGAGGTTSTTSTRVVYGKGSQVISSSEAQQMQMQQFSNEAAGSTQTRVVYRTSMQGEQEMEDNSEMQIQMAGGSTTATRVMYSGQGGDKFETQQLSGGTRMVYRTSKLQGEGDGEGAADSESMQTFSVFKSIPAEDVETSNIKSSTRVAYRKSIPNDQEYESIQERVGESS